MAKFRTNHDRQGGASTSIARVGIFAAVIGGLFFLFNLFTGKNPGAPPQRTIAPTEWDGDESFSLPTATGEVIRRRYYALSYDEEHEQAEWVAYVLTRDRLDQPWVERPEEFLEDPLVATGSAGPDDYRGSGYDRGHLVPAADMAFSEEAIRETFYFSNISPQARNFNAGIWRELEELTRNWSKRDKKLYVVSGPVLSQPPKGHIGRNDVSIPAAYYKVLLDLTEPQLKGIAFVLPNEISYEPLHKFAVPIDSVEELTGIDFFSDLLTEELEDELEGSLNIDLWTFSKQKYEDRINQWNRR